MSRQRLRAEATFRARSDGSRPDTRVPAEVRDFFGCGADDRLVFEDGCEETVARAALYGPYVVVRRASRPGERRQVGTVKVVKPAAAVESEEAIQPPPPEPESRPAPPPDIEPFEVAVRRLLEGRR